MNSVKNRLNVLKNTKVFSISFNLILAVFLCFSLPYKAESQSYNQIGSQNNLLNTLQGNTTLNSLSNTPTVDFYATQTSSQDENMISMTTDLFFTQMQSLSGYVVNDKRSVSYSSEQASSKNISFYAEIQESGDGGWICTLNATITSLDKTVSETKVYNSFYKILMDAKTSLENILANVSSSASSTSSINDVTDILNNSSVPLISNISNMDDLAGTWDGESNIDKIIIMRAGRGFIIFSNGASMNISISMEGKYILVKQSGRSNASFYPELPRQTALQIAATAEPVSWKLLQTDSNTLTGIKTTLLPDNSTSNGVSSGTIDVKWTKRNN